MATTRADAQSFGGMYLKTILNFQNIELTLTTVFQHFEKVSTKLQGQKYPTMGMVIPAYKFLMDQLDNELEKQDGLLKAAAHRHTTNYKRITP